MSITQTRLKATPTAPPIPQLFAHAKSGLLEEGRFVITPDIAQQLLSRFNYGRQRTVEKLHVSRLAAQMTAGNWTPGSQIAFGTLPDGTIRLVNGQHRLHAVVAAGKSIEFQLLLSPVADEAAIHALYYRFDTLQRGRSDRMVLNSIGIAEQLDISRDAAAGAFKSAVVLGNGLSLPTNNHALAGNPLLGTPDGKLATIEPWWPQVKQYDDLIKPSFGKVKRRLLTASIMPVALVTLKYQPAKAEEFWGGVAKDDGLKVGDPRKVMLHVLTNTDFKNQINSGLILTANCWNAWYGSRQLSHTKVYVGSVCAPAGTPYANRKRA